MIQYKDIHIKSTSWPFGVSNSFDVMLYLVLPCIMALGVSCAEISCIEYILHLYSNFISVGYASLFHLFVDC